MTKRRVQSLKRRKVLAAIGVGAGALAATVVSKSLLGPQPDTKKRSGQARKTPATKPVEELALNHEPPAAGPDVRALFGDIAVGSMVGGWTVAALYPVSMGSIPVVLESKGRRIQVDVLRRDLNGPQPVAGTPSLSLFVTNQGNGQRATDPDHGLAAMSLAGLLAKREEAGAPIPQLLTLNERTDQFPRGFYCVA